jgi:hypothetical protein
MILFEETKYQFWVAFFGLLFEMLDAWSILLAESYCWGKFGHRDRAAGNATIFWVALECVGEYGSKCVRRTDLSLAQTNSGVSNTARTWRE